MGLVWFGSRFSARLHSQTSPFGGWLSSWLGGSLCSCLGGSHRLRHQILRDPLFFSYITSEVQFPIKHMAQAPNSTCTLCPYYFHIITLLFLLFLLILLTP